MFVARPKNTCNLTYRGAHKTDDKTNHNLLSPAIVAGVQIEKMNRKSGHPNQERDGAGSATAIVLVRSRIRMFSVFHRFVSLNQAQNRSGEQILKTVWSSSSQPKSFSQRIPTLSFLHRA